MNGNVVFEAKNEEKQKPEKKEKKLIEKIEKLEEKIQSLEEKVVSPEEEQKKEPEEYSPTQAKKGESFYEDLGERMGDIQKRQEFLEKQKEEKVKAEEEQIKPQDEKPPEHENIIVGHEEAIKEELKVLDANKQKFDVLVEGSQKILIEIKSNFPLGFYSDKLTVDINSVNTVTKDFLKEPIPHSPHIEDIESVSVNKTPFFSAIELIDRSLGKDSPILVRFLKSEEAEKAKNIIQGLITAKRQGLDLATLSGLKVEELVEKFETLGKPKIEV